MLRTFNTLRSKLDRRGFVAPVSGLHQGLEFKYRLMTPGEVEDHLDKSGRLKGDAYALATAAKIAERLADWSECGEDEKVAPINAETVRELPHPLLFATMGIIQGTRASDLPPGVADQDLTDWTVGKNAIGEPGAAMIASDRKNS